MKKFLFFAFVFVFASLCAHAENKKLSIVNCQLALGASISSDTIGAPIYPELYGQFAEHLGRCVYGGIWVGPDSDIPNIRGYRKDVIEALQALEVPVIRWPGGCFADEYHWQDGIGPQAQRKSITNSNWGGTLEDNSFGTHEFLDFCELVGAAPYISANVGSGTPQEMKDWIEYMTSDSRSTMAELRRKNGRELPWRVPYIGIGNESWGCGGNMRPEYYADLYRRFSTYCRTYNGNSYLKIASGGNTDDYRWTDVVAGQAASLMDGISVHYYNVVDWSNHGSATRYTDQEYYTAMAQALHIEDVLRGHIAVLDSIDPTGHVALIADEWGTWFDVEPGTNPGWLYQQSTMRDAIVASTTLDIFHRYTRRVRMANIAQMVNVLQAMVLTNPDHPADPCVLTPTYYVFLMYRVHKGATLVPLTVDCPFIDAGTGKIVEKEELSTVNCPRFSDRENEVNKELSIGDLFPQVSATASTKDGLTHISLTNLSATDDIKVTIPLDDKKLSLQSADILSSKDIRDYNDYGHAETVALRPFTGAKLRKGELTLTLPAHSIITLELK